jgi:hypothetical protein
LPDGIEKDTVCTPEKPFMPNEFWSNSAARVPAVALTLRIAPMLTPVPLITPPEPLTPCAKNVEGANEEFEKEPPCPVGRQFVPGTPLKNPAIGGRLPSPGAVPLETMAKALWPFTTYTVLLRVVPLA